MSDIQRAIDKQAKLEAEATAGPWYANNFSNWFAALNLEMTDDDAALIAHLRNQAKLARAVIEAAIDAVAILKEVAKASHIDWWDDVAGPGYGSEVADELGGRLAAWADHVNGEEK